MSKVDYHGIITIINIRGALHKVKICKGASTISHLLLVKDSFSFLGFRGGVCYYEEYSNHL